MVKEMPWDGCSCWVGGVFLGGPSYCFAFSCIIWVSMFLCIVCWVEGVVWGYCCVSYPTEVCLDGWLLVESSEGNFERPLKRVHLFVAKCNITGLLTGWWPLLVAHNTRL